MYTDTGKASQTMTEGASRHSADTRRIVSACYAAASANDVPSIIELMDLNVVLREAARSGCSRASNAIRRRRPAPAAALLHGWLIPVACVPAAYGEVLSSQLSSCCSSSALTKRATVATILHRSTVRLMLLSDGGNEFD